MRQSRCGLERQARSTTGAAARRDVSLAAHAGSQARPIGPPRLDGATARIAAARVAPDVRRRRPVALPELAVEVREVAEADVVGDRADSEPVEAWIAQHPVRAIQPLTAHELGV